MRALLLILALPLVAACQGNPSWQAMAFGSMNCGAVMRAVDQVQVYCRNGSKVPFNALVTMDGVGDEQTISFIKNSLPLRIDEQFGVPVTGIWWTLSMTASGIDLIYSSNGIVGHAIFTQIYGAP